MIKTERGTFWKQYLCLMGDEITFLLKFNSATTCRNDTECALVCTFCGRITELGRLTYICSRNDKHWSETSAKMGRMKTWSGIIYQ